MPLAAAARPDTSRDEPAPPGRAARAGQRNGQREAPSDNQQLARPWSAVVAVPARAGKSWSARGEAAKTAPLDRDRVGAPSRCEPR